MDFRQARKIQRKIKRCEGILLKYENIRPSSVPTNTVFVGNGGLGCSIQRELLMDIFSSYGSLEDVLMLYGKPYSFVIFKNTEDAIRGVNSVNGRRLQSGHVFYLSYIQYSDLPQESHEYLWPSGLILLENFVNEEEEKELLEAFNITESDDSTVLKHRKVMHYGYEFIYKKNNVNKHKSLDAKIPAVCYSHLEKLVSDGYVPRVPDQLTVNHYLPGHGIPPHVDTHSAFEDGIISLSLSSQAVMIFYHPEKSSVPILLPRRSALIMTGESRYLWKHGITPRKTDVIHTSTGKGYSLTLCQRSPRTSLTFRLIREGKCNCNYAEQCDSQHESNGLVDEEQAKELERKYVREVYENIADHFSDTRHKPWPKVSSFLSTIPIGSLILDIGCGNGKHLGLSHHCFEIGCDASTKLAQICSNRKIQVLTADCLKLPFRNNCADVVLCIAVLHHIATKVRRSQAINEMLRVLIPGGKALIYVWAFEQDGPEGPSNYIKLSKELKGNESENRNTTEILLNECAGSPKTIKMPVHTNRTNFVEQNMLVPWKSKKSSMSVTDESEVTVHHRYYHVFYEGELDELVIENEGHILSSYYDKGNWCVLFQKPIS